MALLMVSAGWMRCLAAHTCAILVHLTGVPSATRASETVLDAGQIFAERPSVVQGGSLLQGCISSLDLGETNPFDGMKPITSAEIHGAAGEKISLFLFDSFEGDLTRGQCVVFRLEGDLGLMAYGPAFQGYGNATIASTVSYSSELVYEVPTRKIERAVLSLDELFAGALRIPSPGLSLTATLAQVDENGSDVILTLTSSAGCTGIAYYSFSDVNASQEQTQHVRSLRPGAVVTISVNTSMLVNCMAVFHVNAIEGVVFP